MPSHNIHVNGKAIPLTFETGLCNISSRTFIAAAALAPHKGITILPQRLLALYQRLVYTHSATTTTDIFFVLYILYKSAVLLHHPKKKKKPKAICATRRQCIVEIQSRTTTKFFNFLVPFFYAVWWRQFVLWYWNLHNPWWISFCLFFFRRRFIFLYWLRAFDACFFVCYVKKIVFSQTHAKL